MNWLGGRDTNIQSIPSIILLLDLSSQSHVILNLNLPQLCSLMPAKWVFPAYIYSTVVSFWAVSSLSWLHHIYMSRVSSLWNHRRVYVDACMHAQSCPTFFDPMNCNPAGSSVHGIFQTGILKWVAISFSRRSSRPRDWTRVSHIVWIGARQTLDFVADHTFSEDINFFKIQLLKSFACLSVLNQVL